MTRTTLITGADRGLGFALCVGLLERGWTVYAGQYMPEWPELGALKRENSSSLYLISLDVSSTESVNVAATTVAKLTDHIDMLINNAGVYSETTSRTIREPLDDGEYIRLYNVNAVGPLRVVHAFLPLTDRGSVKRQCIVSSEAGSISRSYRKSTFNYCMSKSALNMGVSILFNHLRPEGYSFRLYHPGWIRSYMSGEKNLEADLEPEEAAAKALPFFLNPRQDEDRLVMVDFQGEEWPW